MLPPEGIDSQKLHGAPPLMPWPKFAEWIGIGDEPIVVRTWVEEAADWAATGTIPTMRLADFRMVSLAGLRADLKVGKKEF